MRGHWPFGWSRKRAAQWFVRLRAKPVTARLDAKFRRWLAVDPANEVEYERLELAWELAGELARDDEIETLLADAQRATTQQPRHARTYALAWSAVATMLVVAVGIGIGVDRQWAGENPVYTTTVGEQRTVVLPDRSHMVLNTSTRARVVFERGVRAIELDYGEATFSVTHDARRPFEVRAAQGTARALGTAFNVLALDQDVTVAVLSGKVEVIAPDSTKRRASPPAALLHPGEEITYNAERVSAIQPSNATRINAWHSGRVAFDNVALQEALREFNRYSKTPIVVADTSLTNIRVSGAFRIGETDALLRALAAAFDIEAERRAQTIELHAAK